MRLRPFFQEERMSTFAEILNRVDQTKPNAFEMGEKLRWLTELNGKLATEVMLMSPAGVRELPQGSEALNCQPLVGYPYEDIYDRWLEAKIDYHNGEINQYMNSMEAYNAAYTGFVNWFLNAYDPVQGYGGGYGTL